MEINNRVLDGWTLVHLGAGIGLGLIKTPRFSAYSSLVVFEILENLILRKKMAELFNDLEGPANIISDLVVATAGYELTRYLSQNGSNTAISP